MSMRPKGPRGARRGRCGWPGPRPRRAVLRSGCGTEERSRVREPSPDATQPPAGGCPVSVVRVRGLAWCPQGVRSRQAPRGKEPVLEGVEGEESGHHQEGQREREHDHRTSLGCGPWSEEVTGLQDASEWLMPHVGPRPGRRRDKSPVSGGTGWTRQARALGARPTGNPVRAVPWRYPWPFAIV